MICLDSIDPLKDWENDFHLISNWLKKQPLFILYKKDDLSNSGSSCWILFQYTPDGSLVRDKMLYASTKNALVKSLGESLFDQQLFCTLAEEVSLAGYLAHLKHVQADAPLTERELEFKAIKQSESTSDISISSRKANAPGVSFPLNADAKLAVAELKSTKNAIIVLVIKYSFRQ